MTVRLVADLTLTLVGVLLIAIAAMWAAASSRRPYEPGLETSAIAWGLAGLACLMLGAATELL
jgi:hypothetical protein